METLCDMCSINKVDPDDESMKVNGLVFCSQECLNPYLTIYSLENKGDR